MRSKEVTDLPPSTSCRSVPRKDLGLLNLLGFLLQLLFENPVVFKVLEKSLASAPHLGFVSVRLLRVLYLNFVAHRFPPTLALRKLKWLSTSWSLRYDAVSHTNFLSTSLHSHAPVLI